MARRASFGLRQLSWPLFSAVIFLAALAFIREEFEGGTIAAVRSAAAEVAPTGVALAVLLTVLHHSVLLAYDRLALRYIGRSLSIRRAALAASAGNAFSQALGFPLLTGAPIRYRLYTGWGLDRLEVAKLVAFCIVSFWLGLLAFGGAVLLLGPLELPAQVGVVTRWPRPLGALMVLAAAAYWIWCSRTRRPLRFRYFTFPVPSSSIATLQILVGSAEWLVSASVLWAVLPVDLGLGLPEVLGLFVVAHVAGLVSHVPGGIGVFEAVVLWYLPADVSEPAILGVLLVYRVVFYVLPLLLGAALLAVSEYRANRRIARELATATAGAVSTIAPRAISALTFVTGTVLVLGAALPLAGDTRVWLSRFVPLPLFEASHFVSSLAGAALLVLARGLQRRLDGAYHVTLALVAITIFTSTARGLDLVALVPGLLLLGALLVSRREFHRESSLLAESYTPGWTVAIALVLVTSAWLGSFAYARVEYSSELWWSFTFTGSAPRFLRGLVGATAVVGLFAAARLLRPAPVPRTEADPEVLERITPIVRAADHVTAHLALVGDKQILLSGSGRSFVMYGVQGDSWIAMGDPVGDRSELRSLAWTFRELADRAGDSAVFYQVTEDHLSTYVELGLSLLKIGEEAHVDLPTFEFSGPRRADFRKALRRMEEAGGSFEIVPRERVEPLLPALREISEAWLAKWSVAEKGFSLGTFGPDYLLRNSIAIVRVGETPVAFGNVWQTDAGEISYDLIRYRPEAPKTTMDYMFAQLISWGRAEGRVRLALGMAPLSGLDSDPLAPLWNRFGAAVFRYGGHFYNFQGLRAYKDKFDPVWEPRYLASPAGLSLPGVLTDLASLIAGGVAGIARR